MEHLNKMPQRMFRITKIDMSHSSIYWAFVMSFANLIGRQMTEQWLVAFSMRWILMPKRFRVE